MEAYLRALVSWRLYTAITRQKKNLYKDGLKPLVATKYPWY